MPSGTAPYRSVATLNRLRREAVALRLGGATNAATRAAVGLSLPTIRAALEAYRHGGWDAVDVGPRGRPRFDAAERRPAEPDDSVRRPDPRGRGGHPGAARSASAGSAPGAAREAAPGAARTAPDGDTFAALLAAATLGTDDREPCWDGARVQHWLAARGLSASRASVLARLADWGLAPPSRHRRLLPTLSEAERTDYHAFARRARRGGARVVWLGDRALADRRERSRRHVQLYAHDPRGRAWWCVLDGAPRAGDHARFLAGLERAAGAPLALVLPGSHLAREPSVAAWLAARGAGWLSVADPLDRAGSSPHPHQPPARAKERTVTASEASSAADALPDPSPAVPPRPDEPASDGDARSVSPPGAAPSAGAARAPLTHLERLEAESIHILREVVAEAENPVMLYSIGKDSAVMLHLARKAFFPAPPPFPLLHVDTTWKFRAMYEFRDRIAEEYGLELIRHVNPDGLAQGVNPFTHGSALHTDIMKTEGLKQALDQHRFDVAFGGARRDEEKSRAKERVFSFRTAQHRWEPKAQRPELWSLYNARKRPGESIRVFPISNWTELDVWQYIHRENIPIVPLYLAAERPVVTRDGTLIMVDDERMPLHDGEVPEMRKVRFRTLGCYPLTGAVESEADTLTDVIREMLLTKTSERQGRMIDHDSAASMEKKKQEGYF